MTRGRAGPQRSKYRRGGELGDHLDYAANKQRPQARSSHRKIRITPSLHRPALSSSSSPPPHIAHHPHPTPNPLPSFCRRSPSSKTPGGTHHLTLPSRGLDVHDQLLLLSLQLGTLAVEFTLRFLEGTLVLPEGRDESSDGESERREKEGVS